MSFFSDYKNYVREYRLEEPFDFLIYRPLAYLIVKSTLFLPLTPNHFTFLAVISGLCAGVFIAQGNIHSMFWGGICIFLFGVFDCCDGMVARVKKNSSKYGDIIDMFADTVANLAFFIGLFIGLYRLYPDSYIPYLLILSVVIIGSHTSIHHFYKKQLFFYKDKNPQGRSREIEQHKRDYEELKKNGVWNFNRLLLGFFLRFSKTQKDHHVQVNYDTERYVNVNLSILPLWAVIAGSTHLTVLAFALMFGNIKIFLYFSLLLSNLWMILIFIVQSGVNANLRVQ